MRIAIEIQPILEKHMTGVGFYTYEMVKRLRDLKALEDEYYLLGMDFFNNANRLDPYLDKKVELRTNGMMHYGIYRRIWHLMPFLDYGKFFGTEADIFHFFNFVSPPYVKGKTIVTVYDMVYKMFPDTMEKANYKKLDRNLKSSCDRADAILTISENSKREIVRFLNVPEEKVFIINPAVDHYIYRPIDDMDEVGRVIDKYNLPDKYFLYLGTLEPRKNIKSIIEAFKILKDRHNSDYGLVLAGKKGWMYDSIFEMVKRLELEDSVFFPGYIDDSDKPYLYAGARAFLFPSLYEGFGMPPLEAMACGTPVIVSNTSSLPEVVGDAGIMIPPNDIEKMSDSMYNIAQDYEFYSDLRQKGLRQADMFSWDKSVKELLSLYSLMGR